MNETRRKPARAAKNAQSTDLETVLEALGVGVVVLAEADDALLFANASASLMWDQAAALEGVDRAAVLAEFVNSRHVERGRDGWIGRVLGPEPKDTIAYQIISGGKIRWLGALAQPFVMLPIPSTPKAPVGGPYIYGRFRLDLEHATVMYGRSYVDLSTVEFQLMAYFAAQSDRLLTKEELLRDVWGRRATNTRTLDVTVSRLRRKLAEQGFPEDAIRTVHGRGYCFLARHLVGTR